jgi:hypothetical protein
MLAMVMGLTTLVGFDVAANLAEEEGLSDYNASLISLSAKYYIINIGSHARQLCYALP